MKKEIENYILELQNLEVPLEAEEVEALSSGISIGCSWSSASWFLCF